MDKDAHLEPSLEPFKWLLEQPSVERWLRKKQLRTKYTYLHRLERFLPFAGSELDVKDPDGFLAWAKSRPDSLEVQDVLEKFSETQPQHSQLFMVSTLRSFLKRNGYNNLPSMGEKPTLKNFHPGYKREEVQSLLGFLDAKMEKLYVLFAKDTGLRAADLLSLRYRHVKKDLETGKEFVHIRLEPEFYNRRKASGITFIGPNTVKVLKELIAEGRIKAQADNHVFPFAYTTITEILRRAREKAALDPLIQPSHGLRKFFEQSLDRVGMDVDKKRQLEGHSLGVRFHYTDQNVEDLRKLYQQAYQFLDLSEEAGADSRLRDLEKSLAEKTQHIESLKSELAEQKVKVQLLDELGPEGIKVLVELVKEKLKK